MHLSLSVEDTNKLRAKLGLKLIPTVGLKESRRNIDLEKRVSAIEAKLSETRNDPIDAAGSEGSVIGGKGEPQHIKTRNIESTEAWLDRISKLQESTPSQTVTPIIAPLEPLPEHTSTIRTNEKQSDIDKVAISPSKISPADPLDLPSEHKITLVQAQPKSAVFKRKKIKTNSSKRAHAANVTVKHSSVDTDDEGYYKMLLANSSKRVHEPCEQPVHHGTRPSSINLVTETSAFLNKINNLEHKEENPTSTAPTLSRNNDIPKTEQQGVPEEETSAGALSIAETLQALRTQRERDVNTAPPSVRPTSRNWAKELLAARQRRESERREFESKLSNLPLKQREEAVELFNKRVNMEVANEAKLLENNYEPSVAVKHYDESGSLISSKEAFKKVSKAFHDRQKQNFA